MVEMFLVSMVSKLGLDKENICRQLACLKSGVEQDIWLILARDLEMELMDLQIYNFHRFTSSLKFNPAG